MAKSSLNTIAQHLWNMYEESISETHLEKDMKTAVLP